LAFRCAATAFIAASVAFLVAVADSARDRAEVGALARPGSTRFGATRTGWTFFGWVGLQHWGTT
jgi:hypothetical protein